MFLPRAIIQRCAQRSLLKGYNFGAARLRRPDIPSPTKCLQISRIVFASTQTPQQTPPRKRPYRYPELINVHNAGKLPTITLGFTRIASIVVFAYGFLWLSPGVYFQGAPWYWIPLVMIGSAVPMVTTGLVWGRFVTHVNVALPSLARRSKEDLMRFASNPPPCTQVQLKFWRFRPWAHTRKIQFSELRRLQPSWIRWSNLELAHPDYQTVEKTHPLSSRFAKAMVGRFMVGSSVIRDRSEVPGVWERMLERMPFAREGTHEIVGSRVLPSANEPAPHDTSINATTKARQSKTEAGGDIKRTRPPPAKQTRR